MNAAIREATAADLPAICVLGQEVNLLHHRAWPGFFAPPSNPGRDASHWQQSIASPSATAFVGVLSAQVVAFITVFITAESSPLLQPMQVARVGSVCVAAHVRGQGIGRLLMAQAEQWALQRGAADMRLHVWAFNEDALRFYERLGYGVRSHVVGKELPRAV